ncbi:MAG: Ig-like domain-containing protein, partial [Microgenomates group bacterium]
ANGAIVYLSIANAITQSALTDNDGNWMIPLATARTTDLKDFVNYDRNAQVEEIFVQGDLQTATATLTTNNDNPTPDITLGQTYNFLGQMPQTTPTLAPNKQTFEESLPQISSSSGFSEINNQDLTIIFPADKEQVNNPLPEFLGTGPKGQKLEIKIESAQVISSQVIPDSQGQWRYSPTIALAPGEHTITVSYTDSHGFLKKVSRSFVVLAAGSSQLPSFTATPSGQTTTPTQTPTLTPTLLPSITPSLIPTATPTLPYRTSLPSTESGTPTPGTILPTKLLFSAGFATLLFGAVLLFF